MVLDWVDSVEDAKHEFEDQIYEWFTEEHQDCLLCKCGRHGECHLDGPGQTYTARLWPEVPADEWCSSWRLSERIAKQIEARLASETEKVTFLTETERREAGMNSVDTITKEQKEREKADKAKFLEIYEKRANLLPSAVQNTRRDERTARWAKQS